MNDDNNPAVLSYMYHLMMFKPITSEEARSEDSTEMVLDRVRSAFPDNPTQTRLDDMGSSSVYTMARSFKETYEQEGKESAGTIIRRGSGSTQMIVNAVEKLCKSLFEKQVNELFDDQTEKGWVEPENSSWNQWGATVEGDDIMGKFWREHWDRIVQRLKESIPTVPGANGEPPSKDAFMAECEKIVTEHQFGNDIVSRSVTQKDNVLTVIYHMLKPWLVLKYLKSFEPVREPSESTSSVVWNCSLTVQRNAIMAIYRVMQETLALLRRYILEDDNVEGRIDSETDGDPAVIQVRSEDENSVITRASNGVRIHIVKSNARFDVMKGGDVDMLVVGGGGAGAAGTTSNGGGGGGGGGVEYTPSYTLTAGNDLVVTVGSGGSGSGADGSDTTVAHAGGNTVTASKGEGGNSDGSGGNSGSGSNGGPGDESMYGGGGGGLDSGGTGATLGVGGSSRRYMITGKDGSYGGGGGGGQSPENGDSTDVSPGGSRSGGAGGLVGDDGLSGGRYTGGGGGGGGGSPIGGNGSAGDGGDGGSGVVVIRYKFSDADVMLLSVLERISFSLSDSLDTKYVTPVIDNKSTMHKAVSELSERTKTRSEEVRHLDNQLQQHKSKLVVVYHNLETKRMRTRTAKVVYWTLLAFAIGYTLLLMIPGVSIILHIFISLGLLLFVLFKGLRRTLDNEV